jgi:transcriptional regulator with XRE-family HTH domain
MDHPNPDSPGGRFRSARKRAQLTQPEVAKLAEVTQSTVSDFETGKIADIHAMNITRMCVAVNVTVEYVMLGSRAARDDVEAEAIELLRGADPAVVALALRSLRGMLASGAEPATEAASRKRARLAA